MGALFQNGRLAFCQCYQGSDGHMIEENSIPKRAKDAIKFGITLSKERCRVFVDGIK